MSLFPNLSAKGPKIKSRESMRLGLGVVSLSTLGLLLFYQNTGWVQYSWRFALDFIPAVTLFIATTAQAKGKLYKSLTLWGVFHQHGGRDYLRALKCLVGRGKLTAVASPLRDYPFKLFLSL